MTDSSFNPNAAAIQEADGISAPFRRARNDARLALKRAELNYDAAWHRAYQDIRGQGF